MHCVKALRTNDDNVYAAVIGHQGTTHTATVMSRSCSPRTNSRRKMLLTKLPLQRVF